MTTWLRSRFASLVFLLLSVPLSAAPKEEMARLIEQLGSDAFDKREATSKPLVRIGEPALAALRNAAASSDDAEVRRRAGQLVEVIENCLPYLFNGKDLTGWEGLGGVWKVEGDAIVASTFPGGRELSTFLCTKRTFRDFELRFQARLRGDNNSAVHLRSELYDRSRYWLRGVKCDLGSGTKITSWGTLVMYDGNRGMILKQASRDDVARTVKPDDFNRCAIRCVGRHVTVQVNGVTTMDAEVAELPPDGVIAFHLGKGNPMNVAFKDIQLKDLSRK